MRSGGRERIHPIDYRGVTLDDGSLKSQFDQVRAFYLAIPDDDLLKGFRQRAGRPAPGRELGGWYSDDVFHIFGQILSGLARMYAATGDAACLSKVNSLLHGWAACIAPDGYFFYSNHPNAPHYIYDKMVGGLVDMILYCRSTEAAAALERITRWAEGHLSRTREYAFGSGDGYMEWYTLSENLYRAFMATGDRRYLEFARVWDYTRYWSLYAAGTDIFAAAPDGSRLPAYHAYSHVNTLGGLGAKYLATGDRSCLEALKTAYSYLQTNECFATGGYGPDESLLPHAQLPVRLLSSHASFETQCGSWAAFKMARSLIADTGDAQYGDWVERLTLNGIGASIPSAQDGRVFYYSDYNPTGGAKVLSSTQWTCCAGTRPIAVADYHNLIYFHTADSVYVNLFTPSTLRARVSGSNVVLRQRTAFPESDRTTVTVTCAKPVPFSMAVRMPGWLSGAMVASVNGRPVATTRNHHWLTVSRRWTSGDKLEVTLPMAIRLEPLDHSRGYPAALCYGPVVLAFHGPHASEANSIPLHWSPTLVRRDSPSGLSFSTRTTPALSAKPFYQFRAGEPYVLYLDPSGAGTIGFRAVTFTGGWQEAGPFRYSRTPGDSATYRFEGSGIRWLGQGFDDAGIADVAIDGAKVAEVDQFRPGRGLPFQWDSAELRPGPHTITVTVTTRHNPRSRDVFLNIAGFQVRQ